jgi:guanylate kinase
VDGDARPGARLTVLTGPSGAGRDSVVGLVRARAPFVRVPVALTTRRRRDHEVEGVHYRFVNRADFVRMIAEGGLLEWAELGGNLYGTPREPVEAWLRAGEPVLLVLDAAGALLARDAVPGARLVCLTAPDDGVTPAGADAPAPADAPAVTVVNDSAERAADELVSLLGSSCLTPARPPVGG